MVLPMVPIGEIKALAADGPTVTSITVYRTYQDFTGIGEYGVNIRGTGLSNVPIRYMLSGGSEYIPFTNPGAGSDDSFRQYSIPSSQVISRIMVGTQDFVVSETNMPKISSISPTQVDLNDASPQLEIKGQNFTYFGDYGDSTTTIRIENNDVTDEFISGSNAVTLYEEDLRKHGYGNKNIVIERTRKEGNVDISMVYNQINALRIFESIDLDPTQDVTIYPNRGKIGSQTTITINNKKENYSVFFLENETDLFKYENMGEKPEYQQTTENKSIIKVNIPKGLTVGKTYKVVITNNLDKEKKPGLDMTNLVTKQKVIGDFYVVDAKVGPMISKPIPNQGTSAGSYLTIYGYRLEELKISDLVVPDNTVDTSDLSVLKGGTDDPTKLRIKYNESGMTYKGKTVNSITRDFLVTIGRDALFEDAHIAKNIFRPGDDKEDELYVKTKTIDPADLKDPKKDIVVAITTTIEDTDGGKFEFTELAILEKGYTFLPSYQDPTITKIMPEKIQIVSEANPVTKNTTIHSIEGSNFNVFRYDHNGEMKTNYPKLIIGGTSETNAQIIIEKDSDGKITYTTKENGIVELEDAFFEVLDANGNVVTGVGGNEVGRFITFTIPKDLQIDISALNRPNSIAVANPKRDSADRGIYTGKNDAVEFVIATSAPTIEEVKPNTVTVDGGEDIIVTGRGFLEGIEVFIDGKKVANVTRDIDTQTTRGVLKFKAPKGREGINILQVMNIDGGSDTYEFIFVETIRMDPKITTIAPPRGTEGDVIIIKGDNFLKPDPTVADLRGIGMLKLIGTKVFLGTEEVNKYVAGGGLEPYTPPQISNEPLLKIEEDPWTNIRQANLSPHYKQATVKDTNNNSFKITRDKDGQIVLIGAADTYSFSYSDGKIKGKSGTTSYDVTQSYNESQNNNELILNTAQDEIVFTVKYNYQLFSIVENQYDKAELKLANYYDSLFLEDNGRFYRVIQDGLGRVIITDEKDNTYEVKVDEDKIVAAKGSTSYPMTVDNNKIMFDGKTLIFQTPYYIDPTTEIITGHRVRVLTKNEIEITIPEKQIAGDYDVKVVNPDTKSATIVKGFEYTKPQIRPIIHYIDPAEGSVDGGYHITISGENFGDNPEVRINGVLVAAKDTQPDKEDYKSIEVLVPKYTGNIDVDFVTDKKYVRVHVTSGGASSSRDDLFAYKIASSNPKITKILPVKGPTSGGNIVVIEGTDFRFFEPFKGDPPKPGDTNYEDIDGSGKWTNFNSDQDPGINKIAINDPTIKDYTHYLDSPVLPSIYFGNSKARIVEFERAIGSDTYRIMVLAPQYNTAGPVDIYLRNNDSGQSPNVKYNYEASKPTIDSINTDTGKRTGGEIKSLVAKDYRGTPVKLIDKNGIEKETTIYLVKFGDITNRNITDTEDPNYGQLKGGKAKIELKDKDINVGFTAEINGTQVTLTLIDGKKEYIGNYTLESGIKYIDLKSLKEKTDNTVYPGFELIKVEKNGGRLLIDKGFSPSVEERVLGTLDVTTPTYYRGATVDVVIVNPDGISNKKPFTYLTPGSSPTITNILNNSKQPASGDNGNTRVVQVKNKGGNEIQVIGQDFRPNATILIGNSFLSIKPRFISETELAFTMPPTTDVNKLKTWHNLIVVNEDKGEARSDQSRPTPIYIEITQSESDPEITTIEPNKGSVVGGTKVTIKGKDFRKIMEGYEDESITVMFGEKETTAVEYNNYDSITAIVPESKIPGPVTVRVKNPDGTLSVGNIIFNYISKPTVTNISPNKLFTNDTKTEITMTGTMFQEGAKVIVGGEIVDKKDIKEGMDLKGEGIYGVIAGSNREVGVIGGVEAATVKVENDKTIKVTFPETKDLKNSSIIIINPDGGVSNPQDGFKYEKPIPTKPLVLEAIPGYESTVQLIWSKSDENILNKATDYEVYGRKTKEKENNFIGSTKGAEFLVKSLEPETEYTFMVRALNEHGAAIDFAIATVKTLDKRQDEKLKEKEDKLKEEEKQLKAKGKEEMEKGRLNITLGTDRFKGGVGTVDLSLSKYKAQDKITISIPIELARKDNRLTIKDGTMTTVINPRDMYTLSVSKQDKGDKDAYLRIHIDKSTGDHLPRGKKQASKAYELSFDYIYGKDTMTINQLLRSAKLFLEQDTIVYPQTKNVSIYSYNIETGNYEKFNGKETDIRARSKLILLSDR